MWILIIVRLNTSYDRQAEWIEWTQWVKNASNGRPITCGCNRNNNIIIVIIIAPADDTIHITTIIIMSAPSSCLCWVQGLVSLTMFSFYFFTKWCIYFIFFDSTYSCSLEQSNSNVLKTWYLELALIVLSSSQSIPTVIISTPSTPTQVVQHV